LVASTTQKSATVAAPAKAKSRNGMELNSRDLKAGQDDHLTGTPQTKSKRPLVFFHDTRKIVREAKEDTLTQPVEYQTKDGELGSGRVRKATELADDVTLKFYGRTPRPES
jgi:hypothetical protein